MKVAVAQLGSRQHYAIPLILHRAGMLHKLYTDAYADKSPLSIVRTLPSNVLPRAVRRLYARAAELPPQKVRAFQLFGLQYAWKLRRAKTLLKARMVHLWAGERFNELILSDGLDGATCVYGFQTASEKLFAGARRLRLKTVLDQPIVPLTKLQAVMDDERRRWPGWESECKDWAQQAFVERERNEWELADIIVCGSQFVLDNVVEQGVSSNKCRLVPAGVDLSHYGPARERRSVGSGPLRVLFVGSVGLRKGVPYLLQAASRFSRSEVVLKAVGPIVCDRSTLGSFCPPNVELVGSVTRDEVARYYQWADVFCLPSLCEGSATVVYEALACELPVITTYNTGSIVDHGVEGFVVPIRDPGAIADRMALYASDPDLLTEMSDAARKRSRYGSLEAHSERLVRVVSVLAQ